MNKFLLLIIVLGGAWWHYYGQNELSNKSIDNFYDKEIDATFKRDPEALCNLLADDYHGTGVSITLAGRMHEEVDKDTGCNNAHKFYRELEKIGHAMGGVVQIGYNRQIENVSIAPDKRSAEVETTYRLNVAGSLMQFSGSSTDTLIKRQGKVKLLRSNYKVKVMSR